MSIEKNRLVPTRRTGGFTLVEIVVSTSLSILVAAAAYTFLSATLKLYAENFSLNHSHQTARLPLERMMREINNAGSSPILVNDKGADVAGSGPAAGIRFCTLIARRPYSIATGAVAGATSVSLTVYSGQTKPRESDILLIHASRVGQDGNGVQAEISAIAGLISPYTVTLKTPLAVSVAAESSALILQQGAFIATGGQLRYYNKVMSEARHGASAFNAPSSFRALAQLQALPGQTQALPFSYASSEERLLRVDLRARATAYSNLDKRYSRAAPDFNTFLDMQSSIAVKSAYLDPTTLGAIE